MNSCANNLLILTSPPATGKTYWIQNYSRSVYPQKILLISPLRALANECMVKLAKNVFVMTPEEWQKKKIPADIVIFDEFHLWFYWGDSFRPLMWEVFYELTQSPLTILLTATMNEEMKRIVSQMSGHFDAISWRDFGNQRLKFRPRRYVHAPSKLWLFELITLTKPRTETSLIFCAYRKEVEQVRRSLEARGYTVWSCVGGEANDLSIKVQTELPPDFIVCTSVLSHGVNLPLLKKVYLLHEIKNLDFWIQMVARGGRRGEAFDVFSLEKPYGIKWSPVTNFLAIQCLSLRMKLSLTLRQVQSWFLKESSPTEFPIKSAT